ncbi:hypothetical protein, partial [Cysteiniphilum halobium]|uniref:hypothetical protein n=1 Tax=Cysteiniphilum halobium TaxID=2219059 RepID=UPI0013C2AEF6
IIYGLGIQGVHYQEPARQTNQSGQDDDGHDFSIALSPYILATAKWGVQYQNAPTFGYLLPNSSATDNNGVITPNNSYFYYVSQGVKAGKNIESAKQANNFIGVMRYDRYGANAGADVTHGFTNPLSDYKTVVPTYITMENNHYITAKTPKMVPISQARYQIAGQTCSVAQMFPTDGLALEDASRCKLSLVLSPSNQYNANISNVAVNVYANGLDQGTFYAQLIAYKANGDRVVVKPTTYPHLMFLYRHLFFYRGASTDQAGSDGHSIITNYVTDSHLSHEIEISRTPGSYVTEGQDAYTPQDKDENHFYLSTFNDYVNGSQQAEPISDRQSIR